MSVAAVKVLDAATEELDPKKQMSGDFIDVLERFHVAARKYLGHFEAVSPKK